VAGGVALEKHKIAAFGGSLISAKAGEGCDVLY
jgi:hypothetical protein